jgi:hypothetical protein
MRHGGYVRNFESLLVELTGRGHDVHVALGGSRMRWLGDRTPPIVGLAERHERLTYGPAPDTAHRLARAANAVRTTLDWLRYQRPEYAAAPKLRARLDRALPERGRRALLAAGAGSARGNAVLRRALEAVVEAMPWAPAIDRYLAEHAPDVVLVTPLVDVSSTQSDVLRGARALGIPAVLCVASWDNLTNKGLIKGRPDLVTVWNEAQREEAVRLHRQRPERVVATGAQSYDHWFAWRPRRSREELFGEIGLDPARPFVLFLGSSPFVAPEEVPFVRRWVATLRSASDPAVRELQVVVRPHPQNGRQWQEADLADLPEVRVWPPAGADPIDEGSRADYHDTIDACAAVVGINTSGLIESAVIGRPVLTVLDSDFAQTQAGTLHFDHLRRAGGGLLVTAASLDEHAAQLGEVLRGANGFDERNAAFLRAFVRPHGLERPAAPILADAIERAAAAGPQPVPRPGLVARALRPLLGRAR